MNIIQKNLILFYSEELSMLLYKTRVWKTSGKQGTFGY